MAEDLFIGIDLRMLQQKLKTSKNSESLMKKTDKCYEKSVEKSCEKKLEKKNEKIREKLVAEKTLEKKSENRGEKLRAEIIKDKSEITLKRKEKLFEKSLEIMKDKGEKMSEKYREKIVAEYVGNDYKINNIRKINLQSQIRNENTERLF